MTLMPAPNTTQINAARIARFNIHSDAANAQMFTLIRRAAVRAIAIESATSGGEGGSGNPHCTITACCI